MTVQNPVVVRESSDVRESLVVIEFNDSERIQR